MIIGQIIRKGDRLQVDTQELHCGDVLQVLIYDGLTDSSQWVETRLEHDQDFYLVGLWGYQIEGLFARIR